MLLYLTTNEDINLFDWIETEKNIPIKKMVGLYDLKKFFLRDMRNLNLCRYVVINTKAVNNTVDEIVEAIQAVTSMYVTRIIIFAEGEERGSELLSKLFDIDCYNIIISTRLTDIKKDMERCLSETGTSYELALSFKFVQDNIGANSPDTGKYRYFKKGVYVAFLSPFNENLAIKSAFSMANWLGKTGAKVAVINMNTDVGFYQSLMPFYPALHIQNGIYKYGNCDFYLPDDTIDIDEYNFVFFNIGTQLIDLDAFECVFVCSEAYPWNIATLKDWLAQIGKSFTLLLHDVSVKHHAQIRELLKKQTSTSIFFLSQINDIFDTINRKVFEQCLEGYFDEVEE